MPFVNGHSRTKVYNRWNATFPNELANEVEVVVADQPRSAKQTDYYRTISNTTVNPTALYNRIRGIKQSNRTLRIKPSRRRPANRSKLLPRNDYISNDVYRRPVVEYVQDSNYINSINGNGNGNGYRNGFKPMGFNVDIHQRQRSSHKKHNSRLNNVNGEYTPHQHRHHLGEQQLYAHPVAATPATPKITTTLTTTTTTTTTPAPKILPTKAFQMTTERTLSHEEKKARRQKLRDRLSRLSDDERDQFYAERAKRKRTKKVRSQNETIP